MRNIKEQSYYYANEPQVIAEFGSGRPSILFTVGAHGNEVEPVYAAELFLSEFSPQDLVRGKLQFVLANPPAVRAGKRFLTSDLNRSYPGDYLWRRRSIFGKSNVGAHSKSRYCYRHAYFI